MTRYINSSILLILITFCPVFGADSDAEKFLPKGEKHIVIMHPTVANLRTWHFLTSEGILPLPAGLPVLGVYSEKGAYDYSLSHQFIKNEGLHNITLLAAGEPPDPESLFEENSGSAVFRKIFEIAAAIVFFGGPDIPAAIYGHEQSLLTVVSDPHRHYLELSLLFHLLGGYQNEDFEPLMEKNPGLPVLGICLGMQTMNVATGGTMIQDIPFELYGKTTVEQVLAMEPDKQHRNYFTAFASDPEVGARSFHRITVEEESHMESIAGSVVLKPHVLSSHHQALGIIGRDFRVTAWCMDQKVPEAIEHVRYPNVIGVQFHPEVSTLFDPESKITFYPGQDAEHSFIDLYPGRLGEDFHNSFWRYFGRIVNRQL